MNIYSLLPLFYLDFLAKRLALMSLSRPLTILPFLSLELSINRGISWSLLSSQDRFQFVAVTFLVVAFLVGFIWYTYRAQKEGKDIWAEQLVIIGGLGNVCDRLAYGGVVDFIHFHYGSWSFPIFNLADVWIVGGVFVMIVQTFFPHAFRR